ncbi:leucyl/phenylalanyl-tRNA--protein transferase [Kaistia dalseonensis]|uniref:Leucyl/phenylalanyl-tRNA--protein transferase n=1 Tax=Kaistia dalseonensis TaxID=410840 RepID=A0ABU0H1B2_9HYPH|nr:leucyl/phenylalanyl-tRNA--protein transferase [Kaistia dalseonensis]MCX5493538.1 leucyl/phenylalanyl-tRNA--protein transferase [Kaistia dalseonensis]MDQ0436098.1 leucyl/phenylalanyl-tRNA--protein transferase [Kaistia dalseonensis]
MAKQSDQAHQITPQVLLKAYACGIFPMSDSADDPGLYWIEPEKRGIFPLDAFHVPRRLARTIRKQPYEIRVDTDFAGVIAGCAGNVASDYRDKTWINQRIRQLYADLFALGHCHTVEVWREGVLVGGLYGVRLGGAFFGESMFSHATDASKIALVYLVARLKAGGFTLLDAQFTTEHLEQFGVIEIDRSDYHRRLEAALPIEADFYGLAGLATVDEVLQLASQTS